ncbi:terpenoid synthase [Gymnopus androsaceus JB14]|uniref:(2E,6E)-farnesyl diphosphate synthase n=1 Tax=Gymnopus androsaceus JB14 TaxID=1447944 RepID=A0A6A4GPT5_9AGAR|nr:terpenoid synthase [Gymnopus androsaceus JB14]
MLDYLNILSSPSVVSEADEEILLKPFRHVETNPGKRTRTLLLQGFNEWFTSPQAKLDIIIQITEMLHNASLLLDDIQDNSDLRRGKPTAHKVYGVAWTINAANHVIELAHRLVESLGCDIATPTLHGILNAELINLYAGQGIEIFWRDTLKCPTEMEYIDMANKKTSGLFRLAIRLLIACSCECSAPPSSYITLVNLLGVYFQIRDDLLNLINEEYADAKGFAEDLEEGKFSFPIIHGINADMFDTRILDTLCQRPKTPGPKYEIIKYLKYTTKSLKYTVDSLEHLESLIRKEMVTLGPNHILEDIIGKLHVGKDLVYNL